jgi:hypothetical protein
MACVLLLGLLVLAPATNGASAGQAGAKHRESGRNYVLERKRRSGTIRIPLPRGPGQIYYDYPYYYARGHYPRHIGGYVYYPPYSRCGGWYLGCGSASARRHRGGCRCP